MSDQPTSRQELYDRVRQSSQEEVILEEMIRLGFWPSDGEGPEGLAGEMRRLSELRAELRALRTESTRLRNPEAILRELRKRRMAESRKRRAETKQRREDERRGRAVAWKARQRTDIVYLGREHSTQLGHKQCDGAALARYQLPVLGDAGSIARAMGVGIGQLRFLAFARRTSRVTHYQRFCVPKKSGGTRLISAPMPKLKAAQHWILENILYRVPSHEAAHGFLPGRSIVSNAQLHVGQRIVVNVDLENFFPTIDFRRVIGQFRALGYSGAASTIFALICTEAEVDEVELDGRTWYVAQRERHLPQGAPTSPQLTNLLCRRLDRKLTTMAENLGFRYSRYADDLTFSGEGSVVKLLARVRYLVRQEGFKVHPGKTRILRKGRRQEVTGLIVNEALGVDRKTLRKFRATLYQIEKDGPVGKTWGHSGADLLDSIQGYANFVFMVDAEKGRALKGRVAKILAAYRQTPAAPVLPSQAISAPVPSDQRVAEADEETGEKDEGEPWWKLW